MCLLSCPIASKQKNLQSDRQTRILVLRNEIAVAKDENSGFIRAYLADPTLISLKD